MQLLPSHLLHLKQQMAGAHVQQITGEEGGEVVGGSRTIEDWLSCISTLQLVAAELISLPKLK
jgi:hypothetical protein